MFVAERPTRRESVLGDLSELATPEDEFTIQPAFGRREQLCLLQAFG